MGVNKVLYGGKTVVDLTDATASPDTVLAGYTAYGADGNKIFGTASTGASLTVTAPAWVTVTVSKDGKTMTEVADASGVAVFEGLETGDWTITITDGEATMSRVVTITADYSARIAFFSAAIRIIYPEGFTCTITDGEDTFQAPDTTGAWTCVVNTSGIWTVTCTDGEYTVSEDITIHSDGQVAAVYFFPKPVASNWVKISNSSIQYTEDTDDGLKLTYKANTQTFTTRNGCFDVGIDLTEYNQLVFRGIHGNASNNDKSSLAIFADDQSTIAASVLLPNKTESDLSEYPIPCESLSGIHYAGVNAKVGAYPGYIVISSIVATS